MAKKGKFNLNDVLKKAGLKWSSSPDNEMMLEEIETIRSNLYKNRDLIVEMQGKLNDIAKENGYSNYDDYEKSPEHKAMMEDLKKEASLRGMTLDKYLDSLSG